MLDEMKEKNDQEIAFDRLRNQMNEEKEKQKQVFQLYIDQVKQNFYPASRAIRFLERISFDNRENFKENQNRFLFQIRSTQMDILEDLSSLVGDKPGTSNYKKKLEQNLTYQQKTPAVCFSSEDMSSLITPYLDLIEEEKLSKKLSETEEEYQLGKTLFQDTYERIKQQQPTSPLSQKLNELFVKLESIQQKQAEILATKKAPAFNNVELMQTQMSDNEKATSKLKELTQELTLLEQEIKPAIEELLKERIELPSSLEARLESIKNLIDLVKANTAYEELAEKLKTAESQLGKCQKSAERDIESYKEYPASDNFIPKRNAHLIELKRIENSLKTEVEEVNIAYLKRISDLNLTIQKLKKIKNDPLLKIGSEFDRFDHINERFLQLKASTANHAITEIFNLNPKEVENIEMEIEGQQQRAVKIIQKAFENESNSINEFIKKIKDTIPYNNDRYIKAAFDDINLRREEFKDFDRLDSLKALREMHNNLTRQVTRVNNDFHLRKKALIKQLTVSEVPEGDKLLEAQIGFFTNLRNFLNELHPKERLRGEIYPLPINELEMIERKIELIQKIKKLNEELCEIPNNTQVDETKRLQRELAGLIKPQDTSIDEGQLENIQEQLNDIQAGINLKHKRLQLAKPTSEEVSIFKDLITAIDKIKFSNENVASILETIKTDLKQNLDAYLEEESVITPKQFVENSLDAINNALLDKQDNLRQLSSQERNYFCNWFNEILQPIYEFYRQKRYGETYSPQFFSTGSETRVAQAANSAHNRLRDRLNKLAAVQEENEAEEKDESNEAVRKHSN